MTASSKLKWANAGWLARDRLSTLPDCLIHTILSFLKARQVVQTCVLSKRWRHLWRSVPCLDIDQREFRTVAENSWVGEVWDKFEDFTDKLLYIRNSSTLDSFRLYIIEDYPPGWGARWIRRLELGFCCRLTSIRLFNVYLDCHFAKLLSSGCPALKDLELKRCWLEFKEITSHTLSSLIIDECTNSPSITAPALASLQLELSEHNCENGTVVNEMPSLVKASIHVTWKWIYHSDPKSTFHKEHWKLLGSLFNAASLELYGFKTMVIRDAESDNIPTFHNLRALVLDGCDMSDNLKTLEHVLQNVPELEKLTLQYCKFSEQSKRRIGRPKPKPKPKPKLKLKGITFQCTKLKLIEITHDDDDGPQLVELLSDSLRNLRKTKIILTKLPRT